MSMRSYNITEQDIISGEYRTEDMINIFCACSAEQLNPYQLDIKTVYWYVVRVILDGHSGFFRLSDKETWCDTVQALKNIGFDDCAEWIEEFIALGDDNLCGQFDKQFSDKYKPDVIHGKIGEYIMKNPGNIAFSGEADIYGI
ncbi:MAG: hypothetical protein NC489_03295 [Ruminococcus flavefaciens]|nr:hypothetical protein [Ruminococcus flavefaciens]